MVAHFFAHLDAVGDKLPDVLDGEFYVHGWPLQRIAAAMTVVRERPIEDTLKVQYHVYDTVSNKQFTSRYESLQAETELIKVVPTEVVRSRIALQELHSKYIAAGYEGTMVRSGTAPYLEGRTRALQKIKKKLDYEVQVIGIIEGTGKFTGMVGALVVEDPVKGVQFKVGSGSGFTDKSRKELWDNPPIGKWITISSEAGLSDGGIPLQAQFELIIVRDYEG